MVRPSLKSTCKVSSVTVIFSTAGISISIVEVCMPCLSQLVLMAADNALKTSNFISREPAAALQVNRFEPKFSNSVFSLDMNVKGFVSVAGKKEKTIRSDS